MFTRELVRRMAGTGVTANCLHSGFVATRFGEQSGGLLSYGVRLAKTFAITPEKGDLFGAIFCYRQADLQAAFHIGDYAGA